MVDSTTANQGLLASATEHLDESVLITDAVLELPGPRIVYVNRAFTRMTGYAPEEVLGKTPRILQGPKTDRAVLDRLRAQLARGVRFEGQTINYRKDGAPFVIRWYIEALRDTDGVIRHFMAVQRDVTEQIRDSRHRRRLETALARSSSLVVMFDDAGALLYCNAACDKLINGGRAGWPRQNTVAKQSARSEPGNVPKQKIWQGVLRPRSRATLNEIRLQLREATSWRGEVELRDGAASPLLLDTVVVPVFDELVPGNGRPDCFVAIAVDITRNRRLEAIAEAHNLADSVGYVFAGIRHELGNPINSIKAAVTLLHENLSSLPAERVDSYLERVLGEIERVEYLLDALRGFSLFQAPELEPIDLGPFLDRFISLIQTDLDRQGVSTSSELAEPVLVVHADPRALHQVLLNLVTNAIDALAGRPNPAISFAARGFGEHVYLAIADNGLGISDEDAVNIFRPFFSTKHHGSGLGLAISRKLVSQMNGTLEVESRVRRGTTFTLGLDRAPKAP